MHLGDVIKKYRYEHERMSMQTFADKCGLSKGYIAMLERNINSKTGEPVVPSVETFLKVAKAMNISLDDLSKIVDENQPISLMENDLQDVIKQNTPPNLSTPAAYPVPILGTICAGDGVICEQNYDGYFFIDNSVRADYCLHVVGDSMIDAEIYDGDIAFIKKDSIFEDGKIYAVIYGIEEKASLKKLYREDGHWILMPCNTEYKPIIADPDDVCVIGECIGVYRGV